MTAYQRLASIEEVTSFKARSFLWHFIQLNESSVYFPVMITVLDGKSKFRPKPRNIKYLIFINWFTLELKHKISNDAL